jgi:cyclopropane-fatty-acyl-phospholipid synthase
MNTTNRHVLVSADSYLGVRKYEAIKEILSQAGILVNGAMPWDLQINDYRFFDRVARDGSLGLGESYMEGWWDCARLDEFFNRIMPLQPQAKVRNNWKLLMLALDYVVLNSGRRSKAFEIGERHYDIGNDLFIRMLDKRMAYSCGYWKNAGNLDEAQTSKLDLICRKLALKPGSRVLDIGCGWGSFARFAAENYGVNVVGITVSQQQMELGAELCRGLPVELRLQDFRDIDEKFDHIVSIGMF